uniref:Putative secreted peptide n=1 Tax=Anopheles braziliensis TaxID=58242 RepID=A0A2M3ZP80_9DIPT
MALVLVALIYVSVAVFKGFVLSALTTGGQSFRRRRCVYECMVQLAFAALNLRALSSPVPLKVKAVPLSRKPICVV